MLELLAQYAEDHDLVVEQGFIPKTVRWAILCDSEGKFLGVNELGDTTVKRNPGRTFRKAPNFSFSELKSGGVTKCHFLVESADVVALLFKGNETEKAIAKTKAKHAYFIEMLRKACVEMPVLGAVAGLLEDPAPLEEIRVALDAHKARTTDKVTIAVQGREPPFLVESEDWHDWWRAFRKASAPPGKSGGRMRCFLTGELAEPMRVHPKIKGLAGVGGLASGDVLASFKQNSFCSYNLKQATNCAVSEEAATVYSAALNDLLTETGQRLAGTMVVHWFKKKIPRKDDPLYFLEDPEEDEERVAQHRAAELLKSIRAGKRPDLSDNYFYALALSGAAGRAMVRDWIEGQFAELVTNVNSWFDDLAITRRDGNGLAPPPKFMAVLGGLVRDLKDLPPPFVAKMWRVAVHGEGIPREALALALGRARADVIDKDRPANHARMGLMRAYHVRKGDGAMKEYLNEDHPHPAYHCGRLVAVMADLQHAALGNVGAGLVQRFYAAASATPALVLGRLVRTSQFHLGKLDPGLAHRYEQRLADIWSRIKDEPPKTLGLEEQSIFALGYYHQLAARKNKES